MTKVIVGQKQLSERLLLALLCHGHVLIEGIPGLAKTLTVNTLSKTLGLSFSRIQFTPDLLPGDLTGTLIYQPNTGDFHTHLGPVFANIVLADEINRSPAKVQSALLEAMQEKQVTLGSDIHPLPSPFLVLATQNPVEQEGTYPLPEAQVDRFLFKLKVTYPSPEEELEVLQRMSNTKEAPKLDEKLSIEELLKARESINTVHMEPSLEKYIVKIVDATRFPEKYKLDIGPYLRFGASPRATIGLAIASKGLALMRGRDFVTPEDIQELSHDVLRHRLALSYKAEAKDLSSDDLITMIIDQVPVA
jgi:MoxR-like ATPase